MDTNTAINIYFDPIISLSWLYLVGTIGILLITLSAYQRKKIPVLRIICVVTFILALLSPSIQEEDRQATSDVAVIILDTSASQNFGDREQIAQNALEHLQNRLNKFKDLEYRTIEAPENGALSNDTKLFETLDQVFSDVPLSRRAGVIILSDGQVHDVPKNPDLMKQYGPIHLLLTGKHDEKDRQLVIETAPSYGIVGQSVSIEYKIEDTDNIKAAYAEMSVTRNGQDVERFTVEIGKTQNFRVPIDHAGQNIFEIEVESIDGELTETNNKAGLIINGVRDRLRVLLVSGKPHAGGRTWRDLLTSDPGVDLVHFTILREPNKLDATLQNELSLIAFPFRELFEIKLYDFDLIIFDRYRLNHILPEHYFENIVRYVREGGALLVSSGPDFATQDSIYNTALEDILPGQPNGDVYKSPYRPNITDNGTRHPVTRDLIWNTNEEGEQVWGHWLRQVSLAIKSGDILMNGIQDAPLLILDRVGEGRVAQLASDHIWLWSRGYEGGGPHREFLRRIVHWLMKEPELDERALHVDVNGKQITLRTQNYNQDQTNILVTKPDGSQEILELKEGHEGFLTKTLRADQLGIFGFEDQNGQRRFAIIGETTPKEYRAVISTEAELTPIIDISKGGAIWLEDEPNPEIHLYTNRGRFAGSDWVGLKKNNDYIVTGIKTRPFLPTWLIALLLLALVTFTWWREGQNT